MYIYTVSHKKTPFYFRNNLAKCWPITVILLPAHFQINCKKLEHLTSHVLPHYLAKIAKNLIQLGRWRSSSSYLRDLATSNRLITTAINLAIKLTIKLKNYCSYNKQPCKCCTTVAALMQHFVVACSQWRRSRAYRPALYIFYRMAGTHDYAGLINRTTIVDYPSLINRPRSGWPLSNFVMNQIFLETRMFRLSDGEEIILFDTIPECDGQTNGQTDRRTFLLWLYQRLHSLLC